MPTQSWCNTFAATLISRLRIDFPRLDMKWVEDARPHIRIWGTNPTYQWYANIHVVPDPQVQSEGSPFIQLNITIGIIGANWANYELEFDENSTDPRLQAKLAQHIIIVLEQYVGQRRTPPEPGSFRYGSAWHALNRLVDVLL